MSPATLSSQSPNTPVHPVSSQALGSAAEVWKLILSKQYESGTERILIEQLTKFATESQAQTEISFGTSGWRGEIGTDFTLRNIQIVALAILKMYENADAPLLQALGVSGFAELQKKRFAARARQPHVGLGIFRSDC